MYTERSSRVTVIYARYPHIVRLSPPPPLSLSLCIRACEIDIVETSRPTVETSCPRQAEWENEVIVQIETSKSCRSEKGKQGKVYLFSVYVRGGGGEVAQGTLQHF